METLVNRLECAVDSLGFGLFCFSFLHIICFFYVYIYIFKIYLHLKTILCLYHVLGDIYSL